MARESINRSVRGSPTRTRPLADGHPRTAAGAGPCGPPGRTCRPLLPQPRSFSSSLSGGGLGGAQCSEGERGRRDLCGARERGAIGGGEFAVRVPCFSPLFILRSFPFYSPFFCFVCSVKLSFPFQVVWAPFVIDQTKSMVRDVA